MEKLKRKRRIVCPHCGAAAAHDLQLDDYIYLHKCHRPSCEREFAVSVTWKSSVALLTAPAVANPRHRTIGTVREYLTDCRADDCQMRSWLPLGGPNNDQAAMFWCPDHLPTVATVMEDQQRASRAKYLAAHDKRMAMEGTKRTVVLDEQGGDVVEQRLMRCTAKCTGGNGARCSNMQWLAVETVMALGMESHFLCWSHERQRLAQSA